MEYNLYNTHLIDVPAGLDTQAPEALSFNSYLIKAGDLTGLRDVLVRIFGNKTLKPFSVTVDIREGKHLKPDMAFLNLLCDVFSHPSYYKKENRELLSILYLASDEPTLPGIKNVWGQFFISQGFEKVLINPVDNGKSRFCPEGKYMVVNNDGFDDVLILPELIRQLIQSGAVNTDIFFTFPKSGFPNRFEEIYGLEMKQFPVYYRNAINLIHTLSNEIQRLNEVNAADKSDIDSLQIYNNFLLRIAYGPADIDGMEGLPQSEVARIRKFYYNEYEILPMWYKRFGHIIKVLTGKRTFKSLFDDNVQKYKKQDGNPPQ